MEVRMVVSFTNSEIRSSAWAAAKPQLKFLGLAYFFYGAISQGGQLFNVKNPTPDAWAQVLFAALASLLLPNSLSLWFWPSRFLCWKTKACW